MLSTIIRGYSTSFTLFYNKEKWFDCSWLEDCISSLWELGIKNDLLGLLYSMNLKATVTVKTPLGDTEPVSVSNIVKQEFVLGPVLNSCSLDRMYKDDTAYNFGFVRMKPMEFVDDIAGTNKDRQSALLSNCLLENIQHEKALNFCHCQW